MAGVQQDSNAAGDADLVAIMQKYAGPEIDTGLAKTFCAIARACGHVSEFLWTADGDAKAGTTNDFGDDQLHIDLYADKVIFDELRACGAVATASSEEKPTEIDMGGHGYCVGHDPLDGSSIIDANFAVGSIFGIWPGKRMLGQTGRDQLASCMAVYGPRTHLAVALNSQVTGSQAVSFDLTFHPHQKTWMISRERLRVQPSGRIFAPGNLRATQDLPRYKSLFDHWLENKYTLRYSGGMVGDVYHILIKEKGVFTNVPSTSAKAKLRLVFECAPIALLVEAAGGASLVSPDPLQQSAQVARSVLDVRIDDMDQRLGVCYGGTEEIEICKKHLFG